MMGSFNERLEFTTIPMFEVSEVEKVLNITTTTLFVYELFHAPFSTYTTLSFLSAEHITCLYIYSLPTSIPAVHIHTWSVHKIMGMFFD